MNSEHVDGYKMATQNWIALLPRPLRFYSLDQITCLGCQLNLLPHNSCLSLALIIFFTCLWSRLDFGQMTGCPEYEAFLGNESYSYHFNNIPLSSRTDLSISHKFCEHYKGMDNLLQRFMPSYCSI